MNSFTRRGLFVLFFLSGFCSLVYQVVWTRMAFASFGIITPVLSVVLSVFMLGLALGSWAGGRWVASLTHKTGLSALYFYAAVEALIGLGAFAVPMLFAGGESVLLSSGEMNSFRYLSLSALVLAASILPWCVCMGATFPLMMAFVRERAPERTESFSFLYLANVLGAMSGTFMCAIFWVEIWGFRHSLQAAAAGNFTIAFTALCLARQRLPMLSPSATASDPGLPGDIPVLRARSPAGWMIKIILFATGFTAMAMEVVWTRAFTPVLKTQVYSFAMIVFTYLGATFLGSLWYRHQLKHNRLRPPLELIGWLAVAAFLPILIDDARLVKENFRSNADLASAVIVLASICPLCAILGYLTPSLIDEYSAGRPDDAGTAYAINVLGCILGPLFASYILLPWFSERHALILLGLPLAVFFLAGGRALSGLKHLGWGVAAGVTLAWALFFSRDYEGMLLRQDKNLVVRRDYAASVMSFGQFLDKNLLVNGIGMTRLTPITKFMVHLPLAFHRGWPDSALIICFGMGTTYRSALSWNVDTTAVELVPSVVQAFGYYHADAAQLANNPKGHIVIDDGRRYLKRTTKKFDVIVVDPPPPVEAAGSSLLYSREFYALARQHLKPDGILETWFPGGEIVTAQAAMRSIYESFPYVRCFPSVEGWGIHLLASDKPIEVLNASQLAERMPEAAQMDLLEWTTNQDGRNYLHLVLSHEISVPRALNPDPTIEITDDHPFNEYYLLR
jgi:predicted membrane-bound spermidine synthase